MKSEYYFKIVLMFISLLLASNVAIPAEAADSKPSPPSGIQYTPPLRGAPGGRVGAGSRGDCDAFLTSSLFTVILPDHVALTSSSMPSLYWYIDKPTTATVEVTLMDMTAIDPLLEMELDVVGKSGFLELELEKYGIRLAPGKSYQWSMSIICDQKSRANNSVVSGHLQYVPPPQGMSEVLAQSSDIAKHAQIYGKNGYWIDMFHALSTAIRQQPDNKSLWRQRIELVRMIDLHDIFSFESKSVVNN